MIIDTGRLKEISEIEFGDIVDELTSSSPYRLAHNNQIKRHDGFMPCPLE